MKRIILNVSILAATLGFTLSSCKKNDPTPVAATTTTASVDNPGTQSASINDNSNASSATDLALNDVNGLVGAPAGARLEVDSTGYTVVSNTSASTATGTKMVHITYNNTTRFGRIRSGSILITLTSGTHFKDKGAIWTVSFSGYSVKKVGDNDTNTIVLNGLHTVTNVNGGLVSDVINKGLASVVHQTTGSMSLTFGSGKSRDWQISRQLTYSNTQGVIGYMVEGTGGVDGYTKLSEWGTNRFGEKFYTSITTAIQSDTHCGLHKPFAGVREHWLISTDGKLIITTIETISKDDNNCDNSYTIVYTNAKGVVVTKKVSFS